MFQIGAGKPILGYFPDAPVFHIRSEDAAEHRADLRFPLTAAALYDHHALTLVAGNQAVAEKFLQGGNVLWVQQVIQKP